jgi:broad specificity phosphatase PhoE
MKNLYFIRHGQSEANVDWHILQTRPEAEIPLTPKGVQDAKNAAYALAALMVKNEEKNPKVFVSPWLRAVQTYEQIANELNITQPPVIYNGIHEHFMNLVGHKENWDKFVNFRDTGWNLKEHMDVTFEGGESFSDVVERANKFLQYLLGFPDGPIVVVSHGLFIKVLMSLIDNVDPETIPHPLNGEVIRRKIGMGLNSYDQLKTYCDAKGYKIIPDCEDYGMMKVTNKNITKRVSVHVSHDSTRQILEMLQTLEN